MYIPVKIIFTLMLLQNIDIYAYTIIMRLCHPLGCTNLIIINYSSY